MSDIKPPKNASEKNDLFSDVDSFLRQCFYRSKLMKYAKILLFLAAAKIEAAGDIKNDNGKPNVLFIAVDDLRPQLGCYGAKETISPSIDKLAQSGVTFTNAYCSVPVCGASRASLLKGARGTRERFVSYAARADKDMPNADSLPMTFKKDGYDTMSVGKVYHHSTQDDLNAWTQKPWAPRGSCWMCYVTDEAKKIRQNYREKALKEGRKIKLGNGPAFEAGDVPDNGYPDGKIADQAIKDLKILKKEGKPFFLGVGFHKPHLPFLAPKKYWDMYNPDKLTLANNPLRAQNAPNCAFSFDSRELRRWVGIPKKGPIPEEIARKAIHGYYACVSYADAQVGRVIAKLDKLGLRDNTIIVFWGDHGWQLGEHGLWGKHTNFNASLNAPLIISAPGMKKDVVCDALVEFVDIYPTLCDLAHIPKPSHLDGESLVPLLKNPNAPWKDAVFSRFLAGESVRTKRYLYTEWSSPGKKPYARMLYDLQKDPQESVNVAEQSKNAQLVKQLHGKLKKVWPNPVK